MAAAEQFQYPEASLFARLSIVEAALDFNGSVLREALQREYPENSAQ